MDGFGGKRREASSRNNWLEGRGPPSLFGPVPNLRSGRYNFSSVLFPFSVPSHGDSGGFAGFLAPRPSRAGSLPHGGGYA